MSRWSTCFGLRLVLHNMPCFVKHPIRITLFCAVVVDCARVLGCPRLPRLVSCLCFPSHCHRLALSCESWTECTRRDRSRSAKFRNRCVLFVHNYSCCSKHSLDLILIHRRGSLTQPSLQIASRATMTEDNSAERQKAWESLSPTYGKAMHTMAESDRQLTQEGRTPNE